MFGYWVGRQAGKLRIEEKQVTYETVKKNTGTVSVDMDDEGIDMLVFDNVKPSPDAGIEGPVWVELKRAKQ